MKTKSVISKAAREKMKAAQLAQWKRNKPAKPVKSPSVPSVPSVPIPSPTAVHAIPIAKIRIGATNPRTDFPADYIAELAASITSHGIRSPLWVRAITAPKHTHELIAGECRLRAATAAKLTAVPCLIQPVDEKGARELQIIENLHRREISSVDEGRGYSRLMADHGYKIEDLVTKLAKSKSYIYGRIKLASAPATALDALAAGKLIESIVLRIARIPDPKSQSAATAQILKNTYLQNDRAAADYIERHFARELKDAPFDRTAPKLIPDRGACGPCPLRSGNQPDQAKGRADICTDPACYQKKSDAGWNLTRAAALQRGAKVFEGEEANKKLGISHGWLSSDTYTDLTEIPDDENSDRTWEIILGKHLPMIHLARAKDGKIIRLIITAEAQAAMKAHGIKFTEFEKTKESPQDLNWKAEQKARELEEERREAVSDAITSTLIKTIESAHLEHARERKLWALMARGLLTRRYQADEIAKRRGLEDTDALTSWINGSKWSIEEMQALCVEALIIDRGYEEDSTGLFNTACQIYSIDPAAIEKTTLETLAKSQKGAK